MPPPPDLALGEEFVSTAEPALIDALLAMHRDIQERADRRHHPVPRGQHPKAHGYVRAEFVVEDHVPTAWRHGIFRTARSFPALVRFSNARQADDRLPDAHGMAIKLFDVEGTKLLETEGDPGTQDFLFIDHPVFFARDLMELAPMLIDFRRLMTSGPAGRLFTLIKAAASRDPRYRRLRATLRKLPLSPLRIQYWTTTPLKLGRTAIKLSTRPDLSGSNADPPPPEPGPDRLRLALARHLQEREARFEVLVQAQTDPVTMPIEDASVAWDEAISPYRRVAMLRIPPQDFTSTAQRQAGENLSFTPWHGLQEHRPLGGINRARRVLYEALARRRRRLNDADLREPTLEELRTLWPIEADRL